MTPRLGRVHPAGKGARGEGLAKDAAGVQALTNRMTRGKARHSAAATRPARSLKARRSARS